jgi:hypothetical protein
MAKRLGRGPAAFSRFARSDYSRNLHFPFFRLEINLRSKFGDAPGLLRGQRGLDFGQIALSITSFRPLGVQ